MKKILLLLFLGLVLNSCSTDSTEPEVYYELLPISRCEMPYRFTAGETYELNMIFKMPTTCHVYKGIYFEGDGNTKTVAIQSVVYERNDCQSIDYNAATAPNLTSEKFNFTAEGPGTTYTFKIWTGKNEQGEDLYYDINVPVDN
ncbi:MAG TPA: hypothetical protein VK528_12180 [Flavobacterium sp.]|nr:hypothetical protein [Flavobacterium sp.]